jgi:hypothetical protein
MKMSATPAMKPMVRTGNASASGGALKAPMAWRDEMLAEQRFDKAMAPGACPILRIRSQNS